VCDLYIRTGSAMETSEQLVITIGENISNMFNEMAVMGGYLLIESFLCGNLRGEMSLPNVLR
jgi:hypothetical protein